MALPGNLKALGLFATLILGLSPGLGYSQTTILHLKNGDRIAGTIISENTNRVLITTSWIIELAVPLGEIANRETLSASTNATPVLAGQKSGGSSAAVVTNIVVTNTVLAVNPSAPLPVTTVPPPPGTRPGKHWKGEARIGADFLYGVNNQQIYSGRFKLTYERPYVSNPKEFFRNILDSSVDYGWTKTLSSTNQQMVQSANRVYGSDKTDVDIGKRFYLYDLAGAGYDAVLKIDSQYELGPGTGYHLLTDTNLLMNTEGGMDYQVQHRSDQTTTKSFYYRLAEDVTWKLNHRVTLTQKLEFFPEVDLNSYRSRFESNLSYNLWQSVSLNLTVLDLYDSKPALDVPYNDLQIRSSLGLKF